ncbi:MAG TPA: DinB family protein [Vicinamibacterales bacterium]|jgi:uncharacterized damage-inducible protein DinB|nr:DinB family protein [Vicinamibacterales bacterium]
MTIAELLLPEFDQEMTATRRVLERVPDDRFGWKPHAKSFSMGDLASHIVNTVWWADVTMNRTEFDIARASQDELTRTVQSKADLLAWFDGNVPSARAALARPDADYFVPWTLKQGDTVYFTMPRYNCVRSFVLNHIVHHRAQLTVYLRENDVPVPGPYGPSADES